MQIVVASAAQGWRCSAASAREHGRSTMRSDPAAMHLRGP